MQLYNLKDDLSELNDPKNKHPKTFEKLYRKWDELNGQLMESMF